MKYGAEMECMQACRTSILEQEEICEKDSKRMENVRNNEFTGYTMCNVEIL